VLCAVYRGQKKLSYVFLLCSGVPHFFPDFLNGLLAENMPNMLLSLPPELIDEIVEEALVDTVADGTYDESTHAILTICKALLPSATRALYSEVEIKGPRALENFRRRVPASTLRDVRSLRLFLSDCTEEGAGGGIGGDLFGRLASDTIRAMPGLAKLHLGPLAYTSLAVLVNSGSLKKLRHLSVMHPVVWAINNPARSKRDLLNACPYVRTLSLHGAILDTGGAGGGGGSSKRVVPLIATHPHLSDLELSMGVVYPEGLFEGLRLRSLTLKYISATNLVKIVSILGQSLRYLNIGDPTPSLTLQSCN
jgi:hypothetical protein